MMNTLTIAGTIDNLPNNGIPTEFWRKSLFGKTSGSN
jgi:hypothetical protein